MDKFSNTYSVRGSELAPDYRLRNFYVCSYFQECFAEFMTLKNMAGYDMQRVGLTWLMSDISAEICDTLPFWRTPVKVEVWTREINPIFVVVNFTLRDCEKIFARGSTRALLADSKTHKPQRFGKYAEKFEACECGEKLENPFKKFEIEGEKIGETLQEVRVPDLDFNLHLNNVRYLPRMFESMPAEITASGALKSFQIKFAREALLGDKILSESFKSGNFYTHRLTRVSDEKIIATMKSAWSS